MKKKKGIKTHVHTFKLNDEQETEFLRMFRQSGKRDKSKFILARIFG